jgi:hypothetical protein
MSASTRVKVTGTVTGTALQTSVDLLGLSASAAWAVTGFAASVVGMAAKATISALKSNATHESNVYTAAELRVQRQAIAQQVTVPVAGHKLSTLDTAKVAAIATCAATPYKVPASAQVSKCVKQLYAATNDRQVQLAQQQLLQVLETGNQQVLIQSLVGACSRASVTVGFDRVKVDTFQGKTRVVATNFNGQALITEIDTTDRVDIATEVLGVTDGTCNGILDRFEQALTEEGVIRDGAPERKFTGGVVELDAAKDFIRSRVAPKQVAQSDRSQPSATGEEQELLNRRRQQQAQKAQQ